MRSAVRWSLRLFILAALAGAAGELTVSGRGGPRTRVYVVDASGSVTAKGDPESLTLRDAIRIVAYDVGRSAEEDRSALVWAGAKPVLAVPLGGRAAFTPGEPAVDADATDLDAALEGAVALAEDGDILLLSDGRGSTERSAVAAAARGI